jgi:hypothetical protein
MKIVCAHLMFLALSSFGDGGMPVMNINQEIHSAHLRILAAKSESERVVEMRGLIEMLSRADQGKVELVDDESVDRVAMLLKTDGNVGRFYGAKALSAIACRAHSALPALRESLVQSEPIRSDFEPMVLSPSVSPYEELEKAIARIERARACPENKDE